MQCSGRDDDGMNLLSALAPTTVPVDPVEGIQGRIAFTAAAKAVRVQSEMEKEALPPLDPHIGRRLDARA